MSPLVQPPGRVLVFSMAGIGDTLMATPVLRELRARWPGARVEVVVTWPGSAQLLAGNPHVDAVHAFNLLERPVHEGLRFVLGLRRPRADVSLTLHPQGRREYRWVAWLAGARRRLSHRYENASWRDRCLVTDAIEQDYTVSCAENNLRLVDVLGGRRAVTHPRYDLFLSDSEAGWARDWCRAEGLEGRPWLGIHVGSGGTKNLALRRWPVEVQVELLLHQSEGARLLAHALGDATEDLLDALVADALLHQRGADRLAQTRLLARDLRQALQALRKALEQRQHAATLAVLGAQVRRDRDERVGHGGRIGR